MNQIFPMPHYESSFSSAPRGLLSLCYFAQRRLLFPPLVGRIARFLCVGLIGLCVDSGLFWTLYQASVSVEIARAISLGVATLVTWALNRLFTFGPSGRAPLLELIRYIAVALGAQGFNYGIFLAFLRFDADAHPLVCLFISAVAAAALSFTGQNLIAFRRIKGR